MLGASSLHCGFTFAGYLHFASWKVKLDHVSISVLCYAMLVLALETRSAPCATHSTFFPMEKAVRQSLESCHYLNCYYLNFKLPMLENPLPNLATRSVQQCFK